MNEPVDANNVDQIMEMYNIFQALRFGNGFPEI